jgi:hypothetical protein
VHLELEISATEDIEQRQRDIRVLAELVDAEALKPVDRDPESFIPVPVVFDGMPNTRWWSFEDRRTNFGDIKPDTTDIAKLMVMEFGLIYANDWFLVPVTLPVGSIANVKGLMVTNVFGERTWIDAAGSGADDAWQRWNMYTLNTRGDLGEAADLERAKAIRAGQPSGSLCIPLARAQSGYLM